MSLGPLDKTSLFRYHPANNNSLKRVALMGCMTGSGPDGRQVDPLRHQKTKWNQ
ncbi:hypothetical protein HYPP_04254 [Hyphomicrobium sp. ghe19]|nr:hypothetical protein HYPP_04254 [Hyphomicrobium sp. ghe19]